jgi:2-octaprenyl-6-methoxyphenol hydroxylase
MATVGCHRRWRPGGYGAGIGAAPEGHRAGNLRGASAPPVRHDQRVLALSDGARQILDWLGVWAGLPKTRSKPSTSRSAAASAAPCCAPAELEVPALGWVVPASDLIAALDAAVTAQGIAIARSQSRRRRHGGFPLTAFAEGGRAGCRQRARLRAACGAVQCRAVAEPHRNVAWERFTGEGPVALLPLGERYSVVLTCADACLTRSGRSTTRPFSRCCKSASARATALSRRRRGWPTRWVCAIGRDPVAERQVWLGNAAQTLHPVAGQGFNLALRDIWELARRWRRGRPRRARRACRLCRGRRPTGAAPSASPTC